MGNPSIANSNSNKGNSSEEEGNNSQKGKDTTASSIENGEIAKLTFPLNIRKEVLIRRRRKLGILPGYDPNEGREKIGSSYQGSGINKGLTIAEEKRFLSQIINGDPTGPEWTKLAREYYAELSVDVPPDNKDGTPGGLKLQIGLKYETKEEYEQDIKKVPNEDGVIVNPAGNPINVADYILWRYCLAYSEVANTEDQVGKSPKIRFFIYTKEREVQAKKTAMNVKRVANKLVEQNIHDRNWVDYMLRNLIAADRESKSLIKDLVTMTNDDKDILLDEYLEKNAGKFVELGQDKNLSTKAFVEEAVASGRLHRVPNTATIMLDGVIIGNSMEEVVAYLNNPKNSGELAALKAQVAVAP